MKNGSGAGFTRTLKRPLWYSPGITEYLAPERGMESHGCEPFAPDLNHRSPATRWS